MSNNVHFSSSKDDWTTPREFFNKLNEEFHFTIDLCADNTNHLVERYFTKENSCLDAQFTGETVFCNPPYGRKNTAVFVKKCSELAKMGNTVVMLIPARTDTAAFHDYIYHKAEIRFVRGRLHFDNSKNAAPFPSMVVIFRGVINGKKQISGV